MAITVPQLHINKAAQHVYGYGRKGTILNVDEPLITYKLGFGPTDPKASDGKVTKLWQFYVRRGANDPPIFCAVWNYKGSDKYDEPQWSYHGPADVMKEIFGDNALTDEENYKRLFG